MPMYMGDMGGGNGQLANWDGGYGQGMQGGMQQGMQGTPGPLGQGRARRYADQAAFQQANPNAPAMVQGGPFTNANTPAPSQDALGNANTAMGNFMQQMQQGGGGWGQPLQRGQGMQQGQGGQLYNFQGLPFDKQGAMKQAGGAIPQAGSGQAQGGLAETTGATAVQTTAPTMPDVSGFMSRLGPAFGNGAAGVRDWASNGALGQMANNYMQQQPRFNQGY